MKIGKSRETKSAIATANADTIVVRGHDLCKDLIGQVSLTEHFWLLLTGERGSAAQIRVLDSCLVAISEHGLVPNVQAARMTYAAGPDAMQGAVAAGLLGCGTVVLGSAEFAARFLADIVTHAGGKDVAAAATALVADYRSRKVAFPGYGHPLHKDADPRAARLIAVATEAGVAGAHVKAAYAAERAIKESTGKSLVLNVSGAIPAVLLDAGFPQGAMKGVPLLARTASLIAHLLEEQTRSIGFYLAEKAAEAIEYDGVVPEGFVPGAH